jgi:hypothetical protein
MSASSDHWADRAERRRLRQERRWAMRGQCDSFAHAIRGPVTLVTVGVLFALNNLTPYGFDRTWPVILIVFGLLTLIGRGTSSPEPPAPPYPGAQTPPPPPPFDAAPPSGSYRQSPYTQPSVGGSPSEPAKGGFGTSAPPRQPDPGQTPPEGGSV